MNSLIKLGSRPKVSGVERIMNHLAKNGDATVTRSKFRQILARNEGSHLPCVCKKTAGMTYSHF